MEKITLFESSQSWDGTPLPRYPEGTPKVTLLKISVPPKTKLPLHKHSIINVGYILKGELIITSETGETCHLKAGDSVAETTHTYHYGENPGNETAEFLVFYAGDTHSELMEHKE